MTDVLFNPRPETCSSLRRNSEVCFLWRLILINKSELVKFCRNLDLIVNYGLRCRLPVQGVSDESLLRSEAVLESDETERHKHANRCSAAKKITGNDTL